MMTRQRRTPTAIALHALRVACLTAALVILGAPWDASDAMGNSATSPGAPLPIVRQEQYLVNARVRPLALFWISGNNVGEGRLTWRGGTEGRRRVEFLVGTDPARAPRQINRWGFIAEELGPTTGDILGVMKESREETLEEAEANVTRGGGQSTFIAVRTRIDANRALSDRVVFPVPSKLTYHELDTLLGLIPLETGVRRTIELPPGTERGFLAAMTAIIHDSADLCRRSDGAVVRPRREVAYLYNQTVYDLSFVSCEYERVLHVKSRAFPDVIDGRFLVVNRRTRAVTKFQVAYGASSDLLGIPVRVLFRPHWWIEVELVLDTEAAAPSDPYRVRRP